jgi:hypothetical protein
MFASNGRSSLRSSANTVRERLRIKAATGAVGAIHSVTSVARSAGTIRIARPPIPLAALCDEIAFWPTDNAAEPDYEIINALLPGMATIPGAMLLCASSPYARRGALWDAHHRHYGKNGDPILVWQADTRMMNPTVPQQVIDKAMERRRAPRLSMVHSFAATSRASSIARQWRHALRSACMSARQCPA